jgi:hypothetical protein
MNDMTCYCRLTNLILSFLMSLELFGFSCYVWSNQIISAINPHNPLKKKSYNKQTKPNQTGQVLLLRPRRRDPRFGRVSAKGRHRCGGHLGHDEPRRQRKVVGGFLLQLFGPYLCHDEKGDRVGSVPDGRRTPLLSGHTRQSGVQYAQRDHQEHLGIVLFNENTYADRETNRDEVQAKRIRHTNPLAAADRNGCHQGEVL